MRFESFSHMLRHWAETSPDRPALLFDDGGGIGQLSFAQLKDAVDKRADELRAGGEEKEKLAGESRS